jgi:integrase
MAPSHSRAGSQGRLSFRPRIHWRESHVDHHHHGCCRLLAGRLPGPVFCSDRRARVQLPLCDLDPESGRARLSYRRAAELFEQATRPLANPGITDPAQQERRGGWSLHQLRHSALTHAAEDGANTATLLSYSGHTSVASLARYARVSPEALARWQQQRDPARRRP